MCKRLPRLGFFLAGLSVFEALKKAGVAPG
jgi:hypothetical protein